MGLCLKHNILEYIQMYGTTHPIFTPRILIPGPNPVLQLRSSTREVNLIIIILSIESLAVVHLLIL